jgi:hypothetical protein
MPATTTTARLFAACDRMPGGLLPIDAARRLHVRPRTQLAGRWSAPKCLRRALEQEAAWPSPPVVASSPLGPVWGGQSGWLGVAIGGYHLRRHAAAVSDGVAVLACPGPNGGRAYLSVRTRARTGPFAACPLAGRPLAGRPLAGRPLARTALRTPSHSTRWAGRSGSGGPGALIGPSAGSSVG